MGELISLSDITLESWPREGCPLCAAEYPIVDPLPVGPDVDDSLDISPTDPLGLGDLLEIPSDTPPAAETMTW